MNQEAKNAENLFSNGYNCAQAVFTPFAKRLGLDRETALRIASGFGAGMGKLQNTCGAVTGAFMVIGYLNGKYKDGDDEAKVKTYKMIQDFAKEFESINDTISCRELIDCDLNNPEGAAFFQDNNLSEKKCAKFIVDAVTILNEKFL